MKKKIKGLIYKFEGLGDNFLKERENKEKIIISTPNWIFVDHTHYLNRKRTPKEIK